MSERTRRKTYALCLSLLACILSVRAGGAQEVRARVVDEQTRKEVVGAEAILLGPDSAEITRATTGPNGFFELAAPSPGTYFILIESMSYAAQTRQVTLGQGQTVIPAFVLQVDVITLDTLQVDAERGVVVPQGVVGFSRATHLVAGERMATLERIGISFTGAVRELGGSVRVKDVMVGERHLPCIESRNRVPSFRDSDTRGRSGNCLMVAIVIDGTDTGLDGVDALRFVQGLQVSDWESIEYLSPVDAGFRYGLRASDRGALVLWTRGRGPHRSEARGGGGGTRR